MKMFVAGEWTGSPEESVITSPYSGEVVDAVPVATTAHVESALVAALEGARKMAALTGYERSQILGRAAAIVEDRAEELARVLSLEQGKPIVESRVEVGRVPDMLRLCAFEGAQLRGETLPLDAAAERRRQARLHPARPVRRRRGDHAVQLPGSAGGAQDRPGSRCGQRGHPEASRARRR